MTFPSIEHATTTWNQSMRRAADPASKSDWRTGPGECTLQDSEPSLVAPRQCETILCLCSPGSMAVLPRPSLSFLCSASGSSLISRKTSYLGTFSNTLIFFDSHSSPVFWPSMSTVPTTTGLTSHLYFRFHNFWLEICVL